MLRSSLAAGLDLLFPPCLALCDADLLQRSADALLLCAACRGMLTGSAGECCPKCGGSRPPGALPAEDCPLCRKQSFHFQTVVSLGVYQGQLASAVLLTKRAENESLSMVLGNLLWETRRAPLQALQSELIIPVPMHWLRRMRQGTNSPDILADVLAKRLAIPARPGLLKRRRNTKVQRTLPPGERQANMRGAFRVPRWRRLNSARVLLVDDILTTGATSSEAARALRAAGAAEVAVAVLARGEGAD